MNSFQAVCDYYPHIILFYCLTAHIKPITNEKLSAPDAGRRPPAATPAADALFICTGFDM